MVKRITKTPGGGRADLVDKILEFLRVERPDIDLSKYEIPLREEFGGDKHWVRSPREIRRQQLVREVLSMFNGRNTAEVARRLGIRQGEVYRIIKQPGPGAVLSQSLP